MTPRFAHSRLAACFSALVMVGLALTAGGCKDEKANQTTIAVIPKGTTHEYWKAVEAGARQAGEELKVNIVWKGPLKEDDKGEQIKIVEQFVTDGVSGIVLAPLDSQALARPVGTAMGKKIPVVIIDSDLSGSAGKDFTSFVATDNKKGGVLGGEQLAKALSGKGNVVLLRYHEGSASTEAREAGFLEAAKKGGLKVVSDNQYGGATQGEAKTKALSMMDKIKECDGVFCPNESSTLGMLSALRDAGVAGKVKFVGFDATPPLVDALRKGEIQALIAQDPKKMGYTGVKTMVQAIKGEKFDTSVDTGVHVITQENLDSAEIKALLGS